MERCRTPKIHIGSIQTGHIGHLHLAATSAPPSSATPSHLVAKVRVFIRGTGTHASPQPCGGPAGCRAPHTKRRAYLRDRHAEIWAQGEGAGACVSGVRPPRASRHAGAPPGASLWRRARVRACSTHGAGCHASKAGRLVPAPHEAGCRDGGGRRHRHPEPCSCPCSTPSRESPPRLSRARRAALRARAVYP